MKLSSANVDEIFFPVHSCVKASIVVAHPVLGTAVQKMKTQFKMRGDQRSRGKTKRLKEQSIEPTDLIRFGSKGLNDADI